LIADARLRENRSMELPGVGRSAVRLSAGHLAGDLRRALLAACIAGCVASPAAAYENWFARPPGSIMQPEPSAAVRTDSRNAPARRLAKHKEMTRKLSAEKKTLEKLPPGPLMAVISIKKQQLTLYAGGHPIAHSPVSTGVPGHPTPQGVFSVLEKQIYHESNIYSAAPMPFMQRVTWSGVAMHQGVVPGHPASHGCIRLPAEFARRLWGITKVGARVIIAQDDVALSEISNKRLFAALPQTTAEAQPGKVRFATNAAMSDAPLRDAGNDEAHVEGAIDRMVQTGMAEAEAYATDAPPRLFEKPALVAVAKDPMLRPGPISVYISRKLGQLFVRKGLTEVFDAPVTIARPDAPLGTHVFTALESHDDGTMRWNVASLPIDRTVTPGKYLMTRTASGEKLRKELVAPTYEVVQPGDPNAALERITIPQDALARINALITPGATLIVSDLGMSQETGRGTDFIVLTR
jgi:lipoprotein-anchoring transpeptidase ErfK/SrfK